MRERGGIKYLSYKGGKATGINIYKKEKGREDEIKLIIR